ncbi:MAG: serine/threonine phosphatase [Cyanophyceae cyanobacterium]
MNMDNVWWAISQSSAGTSSSGFKQAQSEETMGESSVPLEEQLSNSAQSSRAQTTTSEPGYDETYLDSQKRYRLLANGNSLDIKSKNSFGCQVTDLQPWQKTRLEEQLDLLEEQLATDNDEGLRGNLPQSALLYINLQEQFPTIPEIQDAWREEAREVVLISDRSQWSLLTEEFTQLSVSQICRYLERMVQLWFFLAEENCCQSLLVATNLRLDEQQALALQQLYGDPANKRPSLTQLAQMWQTWLEQAGRTEPELLELVQAAQNGLEADSLRAQLNQLAGEPTTTASSAPFLSADLETPDDNQDEMPTVVLPMELRSLCDAGATDVGRQRDRNEDYFWIETSCQKQESCYGQTVQARGLYIVCDGMGGHIDGELASKLAVKTLQEYFQTHWQEEFPSAQAIKEGILLANQTIYQVNQENRRTGNQRMGTTLAMALVQNTQIAVATVGDSRIYRVTRRGVEQLTLDHTVGQQEVLRGVEPETAYSRPDAYQLTQALGPSDRQSVSPDLHFFKATEDTLLLLCSDGLSDNELLEAADESLLPLLSSRANLEQGLHKLIDFADQHNGHDNLTGVVVRVKVQPKLEPTSR